MGTDDCSGIGQPVVINCIVHQLSWFLFLFAIIISLQLLTLLSSIIIVIIAFYFIKLFLSQSTSFTFFQFFSSWHKEREGVSEQLCGVWLLAGVKP